MIPRNLTSQSRAKGRKRDYIQVGSIIAKRFMAIPHCSDFIGPCPGQDSSKGVLRSKGFRRKGVFHVPKGSSDPKDSVGKESFGPSDLRDFGPSGEQARSCGSDNVSLQNHVPCCSLYPPWLPVLSCSQLSIWLSN